MRITRCWWKEAPGVLEQWSLRRASQGGEPQAQAECLRHTRPCPQPSLGPHIAWAEPGLIPTAAKQLTGTGDCSEQLRAFAAMLASREIPIRNRFPACVSVCLGILEVFNRLIHRL